MVGVYFTRTGLVVDAGDLICGVDPSLYDGEVPLPQDRTPASLSSSPLGDFPDDGYEGARGIYSRTGPRDDDD